MKYRNLSAFQEVTDHDLGFIDESETTPEDMLKHVKLAKLILDLEEELLGIDTKEGRSWRKPAMDEQTVGGTNLDDGHQSFFILSDF